MVKSGCYIADESHEWKIEGVMVKFFLFFIMCTNHIYTHKKAGTCIKK